MSETTVSMPAQLPRKQPFSETSSHTVDSCTEKLCKSLMSKLSYVCIGNPGVGKSTILNCLIGDVRFESGIKFGEGLTTQLQVEEAHGNTYIDTIGVIDLAFREKAISSITKLLQEGGRFKMIFVLTLEAGRMRPDDLAVIRVVLDSAPITHCAIVINKANKRTSECMPLIQARLNDLIGKPGCLMHMHALPRYDEMEDEDNTIVSLPDSFIHFLDSVPQVVIQPGIAQEIMLEQIDDATLTAERRLHEYYIKGHATSSFSTGHLSSGWAKDLQSEISSASRGQDDDDLKESDSRSQAQMSLVSCQRPCIQIQSCNLASVQAAMRTEVSSWPVVPNEDGYAVACTILDILGRAQGGVLVVVAPRKEFETKLRQHLHSSDEHYMSERLQGLHASHKLFQDSLLEFAEHTENDCWPSDYWDVRARGKSKDGAMLVDSTGFIAKSAAKVLGLPLSSHQWKGRGTRHATAIAIAEYLDKGIVLIRSSKGKIGCLLASAHGRKALEVDTSLPAPSDEESLAD